MSNGGERRTCSIESCERPSRTRGYCATHYSRWRRTGDLEPDRPIGQIPVEDRFWSKVRPTGFCWEWTDHLSARGYGGFGLGGGHNVQAHRMAYELLMGPIPAGLHLDHLCRNHACVNPDHLEPVTARENMHRGFAPGAIAVRTNRCRRGHEYTPDNTRTDKRGHRECRTCANARLRARRKEKKS